MPKTVLPAWVSPVIWAGYRAAVTCPRPALPTPVPGSKEEMEEEGLGGTAAPQVGLEPGPGSGRTSGQEPWPHMVLAEGWATAGTCTLGY